MSYTNINLVKKHISFGDIPASEQTGYPVIFSGLESVSLPGNGIVQGSLSAKVVKLSSPILEEKTLEDIPVALGNTRIVADSVTLASDSSLGTIYTENVDYSVDCTNGTVKRISGGAITSGGEVSIWYYYYSLFVEGTDYSIDYSGCTIRRLSGGVIQPGQTVYIDYETAYHHLNDNIILQAVSEANAMVEKEVDPQGQFGADITLQSAATYLAVSLLCRVAAADDLRLGSGSGRGAEAWLSLAADYRNDYMRLIRLFRPESARLSRPVRS